MNIWFSPAAFTHLRQPMQAALHTLRFTGAFSGELQKTCTGALLGTSLIMRRGHTVTHLPQPTQISG